MNKLIGFLVVTVILALFIPQDTLAQEDKPQDFSEIRSAAEKGDVEAQFKLGSAYYLGERVPEDAVEAVKWYRKAAEQAHAAAQFFLGFSYLRGLGIPKDAVEAVKWYRKAAEQGFAPAQYDLGVCYAEGHGLPKDYEQAVKWYRKAAEKGDARAQGNLGVCYAEGHGLPKDYEQAVKWYRKAAEKGNAVAQHNLGVMYLRGQGVPKDTVFAYMWLNLAGQTRDDARKLRDAVGEEMTPEQVAEAQKLSREWKSGDGSLVGTIWEIGEFTATFKEDNTVTLQGGALASIAPEGLDVSYSLRGKSLEIDAMGMTKSGSFDGTNLIIDGAAAVRKK